MSASPTSQTGTSAHPADSAWQHAGPPRTQWLQLAVLCVGSFVVSTAFGAILPYLPVFLKEQAHASLWNIGLIAAAYYMGSLVFSAPFGRLSDSVGRKPLLASGMILFSVAQLLFISTTHPLWFVFFRFLEGMGAAAVLPVAQALVADLSAEKDRGRAYGWMSSANFGGLIAGPMIAWPLYSLGGGSGKWAFYTIFLFGSALSFLTVIALLAVVREPEHVRRRRSVKVVHPPYRRLVTRPIVAFFVIGATSNLAMGVFEVLWSNWLRHLGASVRFVGFTWIAFSAPMLFAFIGGRLAERRNRWAFMVSGFAVSGCAWIYYGVGRNLTSFLAVSVLEGLALAWAYPAKQAFFVQVAPPRWLGSLQGLEASSLQVAALVGTLVAPLFPERISGYLISIAGGVSLVGLVAAGPVLYREWNRLKATAGDAEETVEGAVGIPHASK
jgi:MFS family permease